MRRMKQLRAAKKAAAVSEDAMVRDALMKKWANGSRCPFCGNLFDTKYSLEKHLPRCKRREEPEQQLVDPKHPERGKMYKGSLLAALLRRKGKQT